MKEKQKAEIGKVVENSAVVVGIALHFTYAILLLFLKSL